MEAENRLAQSKPGFAEEVAIQSGQPPDEAKLDQGATMFGAERKGAKASAKEAKAKREALEMSVGASPRRIKEMAKRIKPFVEKARLEGMPSEREGLDFVAGLFGFESYMAACAMPAPFEMRPGTMRARPGLFGKDREPWTISSQEMLGGALVLGCSGSGKSHALLALGASALESAPGMGLLLIDGKGDSTLHSSWLELLRGQGREHDLRVLDLLGAGWGRPAGRSAHRFDPIFGMDAAAVAKWLARALGAAMLDVGPAKGLPAPEDASDLMEAMLAVWAQDAIALMRDPAQEPGVSALVAAAALPERAPPGESGGAKAWRARLALLLEDPQSRMACSAMKARAMEALAMLVESYGAAFRCARDDSGAWLEPEIRPDSPLSGHVCLMSLPALEKSAGELADLGRLVACSFLGAMEASEGVAGMRSMAIFDDFGYYGPELSELMPAARRSGVGLVVAAQDLWACHAPQQRRGLDPGLLSSLGALRVKMFMALADASDANMNFMGGCFAEASRPSARDLKGQSSGEAWVSGASRSGQARFDWRSSAEGSGSCAPPAVKCARRGHGS